MNKIGEILLSDLPEGLKEMAVEASEMVSDHFWELDKPTEPKPTEADGWVKVDSELNDFFSRVQDMQRMYRQGSITLAERLRDKLSSEMDDIMLQPLPQPPKE